MDITTCEPAADVFPRNPVRSPAPPALLPKLVNNGNDRPTMACLTRLASSSLRQQRNCAVAGGLLLEKLVDNICRSADVSKSLTPLRSGIFIATLYQIITISNSTQESHAKFLSNYLITP